MRRIIVLLVLATSVIFTIGASSGTPVASAGSCQMQSGSVYWTGFLEFDAQGVNCSGVSNVQFNRVVTTEGCAGKTPSLNNFCATGIYDGTEHDSQGLTGSHVAPSFANADSYSVVPSGGGITPAVVWRVQAWCGGAVHWIATQFMFRIRSVTGWGPWHYFRSTGYPITC